MFRKSKFILTEKRAMIIFIASFFLGVCFAAVFFFFFKTNGPSANFLSNSSSETPLSFKQAPLPESFKDTKTLGILLLGYGGAGHDGGNLTDAIQLLFLDFSKKKVILVSIPRDLWIKLPNGKEAKINAFLLPGANNPSETPKSIISTVTGLPVNYFISVDFVGFMRAIGIELKGIDVNVAETLDDPLYPISGEEVNPCGLTPEEIADITEKYSGLERDKQFPCRYEHLHFEKGLVHMEGGDALKYVRSRHGSGEGDISRGKRQQEVLIAIAQKLMSLNALDNTGKFFEQLTKHLKTDIDIKIAEYLTPFLKSAKDFQVVNINLGPANVLTTATSNDKQAIIIPKEGINQWNKVQSYIKEQIETP
ncbi:MAG: LCP family protein [Patescibacteria group bacterium]|nr:LCP family protein [Patescibacteria group bacterium]